MDERFREAVAGHEVQGVVLMAASRTGKVDYEGCFGRTTMSADAPAMTVDTVMQVMSATKLITSVACMQCVEKGLLDLDADATKILTELADVKIITGFDEQGQPQLRDRTKPLTLRHLLTHSSGLSYDAMHPLLIQYRAWKGVGLQPLLDTVQERYLYPLLYEPGEGWGYGPSTDWAGQMVERANGGISLDEYVKANIAAPLGIKDMTFKLQQRPDMQARRAAWCDRGADGTMKEVDQEFWHRDYEHDFGGTGMFTTPREYIKVLRSLLLDDGRLLKSQTLEALFTPCLTPASEQAMTGLYSIEQMNTVMGGLLTMGAKKSHALGGMVLTEAVDGVKWRGKGTLIWSGYPNVYWSIDRNAGLCCLYASQVTPPGDSVSIELGRVFEREMYRRLEASQAD